MSLVTTKIPCSLIRRLGAIGYDAILLFAVWYLATVPLVALRGGRAIEPGNPWFFAYLLGIAYGYFVWQWHRGGQTLGMKAWRTRLTGADGGPVGWTAASLRFFAALVSWACAGAGYLWCLLNRDSLAWHDHWSRSRIVLMIPAQDARSQPQASGDPAQQHEAGDNDH